MKSKLKKALAMVMLCSFVFGMRMDVSAEDITSDLDQVVQIVNEFRTGSEAWYKAPDGTIMECSGLEPLTVDPQLQEYAMIRANELAISYSHDRPNGGSATADWGVGENIAMGTGSFSAEAVCEAWKETNEEFNGQGHRRNMLGFVYLKGDTTARNYTYTTIGVGHARIDGKDYWVQLFGGITDWNPDEHAKKGETQSGTSNGTPIPENPDKKPTQDETQSTDNKPTTTLPEDKYTSEWLDDLLGHKPTTTLPEDKDISEGLKDFLGQKPTGQPDTPNQNPDSNVKPDAPAQQYPTNDTNPPTQPTDTTTTTVAQSPKTGETTAATTVMAAGFMLLIAVGGITVRLSAKRK